MNVITALKISIEFNSKDLLDHIEDNLQNKFGRGESIVNIDLNDFDRSHDVRNFKKIQQYYVLQGFDVVLDNADFQMKISLPE